LLLTVSVSTKSLPFHGEGVTTGKGSQFMTVLFTDMYGQQSPGKREFNMFRAGLVISDGNRGPLS